MIARGETTVWRTRLILLGCAAFLYGSAIWASIGLSGSILGIAGVWYGSAVAVGLLLCTPTGLRLWAALGIAVGMVLCELWLGTPWHRILVFGSGNALDILLSVWIAQRMGLSVELLRNTSRLLKTLLLVIVPPSLVSAAWIATWLSVLNDLASLRAAWHWVEGAVIGHLTVLPLALSVSVWGWRRVIHQLRSLWVLGAVFLLGGLCLFSVLLMPYPFVFVALISGILALRGGFFIAAAGNLLLGTLLVALIKQGVLQVPAVGHAYADLILFLPMVATLLPALLLGASSDSRRALIDQLETLYRKTPAMLHELDADGRIIRVSDLWLERLGYTREQVLGQRSLNLLTEASRSYAEHEVIPRLLQTGECRQVPYQIRTASGEIRDVLLSARVESDHQGQLLRSMSVLEDVTLRNQLARELAAQEHLLLTDPLTGLGNRAAFDTALALYCQDRRQRRFVLGFLDLDHFKPVNDAHGHAAGDELLVQLAQRLRDTLRDSDEIFRLGGDEFVLLLHEGTDRVQAQTLADKLLGILRTPFRLSTVTVQIGASLGLARFPDDGQEAPDLLAAADQAMYEAKAAGRQQWRWAQAKL